MLISNFPGGGAKINGTIEQIKVGPGATINKGDFVSLEMEGSVLNLTGELLPTVANYTQNSGVIAKWGNTLFVANTGYNSTSSPTKNIYRIGAFTVNADGTLTQIATYVSDERNTGEPKGYDIVALSATRVMFVYLARYSTHTLYSDVLDITGSTFTVVASAAQAPSIAVTSYDRGDIFQLSPTTFIFSMSLYESTYVTQMRVITFSGTALTIGTTSIAVNKSYLQRGYYIKTDTNKFVYRYDGKHIPITVSGTTLTKGTEVTPASGFPIGYPSGCTEVGDGYYIGYTSTTLYQRDVPAFEFIKSDGGNIMYVAPCFTLNAMGGSTGAPHGSIAKIGKNRYMLICQSVASYSQFAPVYLRHAVFNEYKRKNISETSSIFAHASLSKACTMDNGLVAISAAGARVAILKADEWVVPSTVFRNAFGVALESGSDGDVIKVAVPD